MFQFSKVSGSKLDLVGTLEKKKITQLWATLDTYSTAEWLPTPSSPPFFNTYVDRNRVQMFIIYELHMYESYGYCVTI